MVSDVKQMWEDAAKGGGGLSEWVGTIDEAFFDLASTVFDSGPSEFGENVVLVLSTTVDQAIDPPDFSFDTARIILSVGKAENWNVVNGGAGIKAVKGGLGNSKYQQFIKRVTTELGVPMGERKNLAGEALSPFDAEVWNGLKFHFKRETNTVNIRGKEQAVSIVLPVRWLQNTLPAPLA